jgi:hypothetical protein
VTEQQVMQAATGTAVEINRVGEPS